VLVIAPEPPDGEASRTLFAEYLELVGARLGSRFVPTDEIFASEEAFDGPGAAWLVAREDGRAVGCGGLREAAAGVGEVKRMFVTTATRGSGVGRALLAELERRAGEAGYRRVRLYTTEVLVEARALYASEGYRPVGVAAMDGRLDLWLEKPLRPG
jgi:GNAT superfamily N-acetyltransferase